MIYTLGTRSMYDDLLAEREREERPLYKVGRTETYDGGAVFETVVQAEMHRLHHCLAGNEMAVYEVDADWTNDTASPSDPGASCLWHPHRVLTRDAVVLRRVD